MKDNPTYHSLGGHAETIEIDFDPSVTSYEELLRMFWKMNDARMQAPSTQYRSIVFYHDDVQRKIAERLKSQEEARTGATVFTEIVPFTRFFLAEGYHQKYYLRGAGDIAAEYLAIYPDLRDFIGSTATSRVNGYLGRQGTKAKLEEEIDSLGLSEAGRKRLLGIVAR
ncbi:MAG: Peptide methionine sulfoxide reductase MsrA 2 [Syntrophorhabdus sp. PtaB.Bin047]|nr:MAG: Peptide methionine sulfoxide reductase MsrA 2 [Syntrophorhabdus sp. PtaB.Bin047]